MSEPNDVINCRCLGYDHFLEVGLEELKNHGLSVHEGSVARTLAEMQARQLAELERVVLDQFIRDTSLEETMPALTDRPRSFHNYDRGRPWEEVEATVAQWFFEELSYAMGDPHPFGLGRRCKAAITLEERQRNERFGCGRLVVEVPGPYSHSPNFFIMSEVRERDLRDPGLLRRIVSDMVKEYTSEMKNLKRRRQHEDDRAHASTYAYRQLLEPLSACVACGSTACSKCEGDGCKARQKAKREQEAVKAQMARKAEEQKRIDRHNGMVAAMTNIGLAIDYAYQNLDNTLRLQERWTHADKHQFTIYPHSHYKELLAAYKSRLVREELKRREDERAVKVQAELDPWD